MRKICVTGAAGFISSSLISRLILEPNTHVVGVDNLLTGNVSNLPRDHPDNFRFIKADVNDIQATSSIMLSHRFDYVFHYAAVVGVARTLQNPLMVLDDIRGIQNVLELSKNTGVKRVFFSSSSEVYGEPVELPQNEHTTPLNSKLPYAVVKNVGEAFLKSYMVEHALPYTIFRFFNTYGPRQSNDFVLSRFVRAALAGQPLQIYGDGRQTRTFCYIDDNTETALRCLNFGLELDDILNIGSDLEVSILDLAKLVIRLTNSSSEIVHCPALKEGDMTRRCPDNSKMRTILGRGLLPLEDGIQNVIEAIRIQT